MEDPIPVRTLDNATPYPGVSYNDGLIALVEHSCELYPRQAVRVEAIVLTLCTSGKASLHLNGTPYEAKAGDLIVCTPNTIVEGTEADADFDACGIVLARTYAEQLTVMSGSNWDARLFIERHPVFALNEEEASLFRQYYDLLRTKLTRPRRKHHRELAHALLTAFLYDFYDTTERLAQFQPPLYTSGERLFKAFTDLVTGTHPRPRNVAWYADRLNVTPKYLSTVVKERSGEPASAFIQRYIISDITYLLRHTTKSIKEIAIELDFPNLSFFGKYVRHHLGCSPKQFRLAAQGE